MVVVAGVVVVVVVVVGAGVVSGAGGAVVGRAVAAPVTLTVRVSSTVPSVVSVTPLLLPDNIPVAGDTAPPPVSTPLPDGLPEDPTPTPVAELLPEGWEPPISTGPSEAVV